MTSPEPSRGGVLRRLAGEPLVQFLVVGAALFGADRILRGPAVSVDEKRIELTHNDVRQLSIAWLAQGRPAPTPAQLQGLVDQKVAMEVLVREAKDLGLDQDDEVIKRRLAQKMDFLFDGVAKAQEPTEAELETWFSQNSSRFASPPRLDFHHLYFALDHGRTQGDVEAAKLRLADRQGADAAGLAGADPFMFQDAYADATPEHVAKTFGPQFAEAIFALPTGGWQGPVASGYGLHLVYVDAAVPGSIPRFADVRSEVRAAWTDDQTRAIKQSAFDKLRALYTVVTPPLDDPSLVAPSTAATDPSP